MSDKVRPSGRAFAQDGRQPLAMTPVEQRGREPMAMTPLPANSPQQQATASTAAPPSTGQPSVSPQISNQKK